MAFEYPAGHILSAGGYQPPSERPARAGATRQVATGAEPPQFIAGLAGTRAEPQVTQAGFGALIPLAIGAAARYLPRALPWIGGAIAGAGLGGLLGEENGTELSPGDPYGVPFKGPGLKEPGGKYLLKEWHIRMDSKEGDFNLQFYLTINDRGTKRIYMYNQRTKGWKTWPMPRLAVIGKNMPSHQMITRLRRNLKRHSDDAVTILKLTAPGKLESTRRAGGRYVPKRGKRWID
ncbi:hypothetical protein LCGC14_1934330 [marine sediment metagenome]|uniref:Uncharacterized protein n=1 Tax=marine sediment metagenome TaxID=412755 RepID=A0A0F9I0S4_9ZZZZ